MLKRLTLAAVVTLVAVAAGSTCLAQTASSLSLKDATATTRTLCETLDGNGNLTPCLQVGAATSALQTSLGSTAHADAQAIYNALTGPLAVTGPLTSTQLTAAALATAAGQATAHTDALTVAANTKPVTSFGSITVGTAFTPGLGIAAVCTTAGNVVLSGTDGTSITVPVGQGFNQFGFAAASVTYPTSGAASCAFTALR